MNRIAVQRAFGVWCACWAFGLGVAGIVAQEEEEPQLSSNNYQQVLVFESGQTVKGKISRSPNGFVVEHLAGRLVVPYDETWVVADSLTDAYRQLRESFVTLTAATHFELAKWCWANHLREESRAELVMALDRDPDYEPARDLLTRIDAELKAERRKTNNSSSRIQLLNGVEIPEVESLAGLSRETAARFSTRVQPLLINKCGNASCHGSGTTTEFRLEPIRGGGPGHRVYSERNLAVVLNHVDLEHPERSPLLMVSDGHHGGMNRAIFYGSSGEKQRQLLLDWLKVVAQEKNAAQQELAKHPSVLPKKINDATKTAEDEPETNDLNETPKSQRGMASILDQSKTRHDDDQDDAFDPEIFNQKYHGRSSSSNSHLRKSRTSETALESTP